jgi:hypothetical protein
MIAIRPQTFRVSSVECLPKGTVVNQQAYHDGFLSVVYM